jgi:hypothetical protein
MGHRSGFLKLDWHSLLICVSQQAFEGEKQAKKELGVPT